MNIAEMKEAVECRQDTVGFLHLKDILKLRDLGIEVDGLSFQKAAQVIFDLRSQKKITLGVTREAIKLICFENPCFKTERFLLDQYHSIFKYSVEHQAYLFMQKGTLEEYRHLIGRYGRYV